MLLPALRPKEKRKAQRDPGALRRRSVLPHHNTGRILRVLCHDPPALKARVLTARVLIIVLSQIKPGNAVKANIYAAQLHPDVLPGLGKESHQLVILSSVQKKGIGAHQVLDLLNGFQFPYRPFHRFQVITSFALMRGHPSENG